MSGAGHSALVKPNNKDGSNNEALGTGQRSESAQHSNYKGFVAGVFSGISKLSGRIPAPSNEHRQDLMFVSRPSVRHHQSTSTDERKDSVQGASGLSLTDSTQ